MMRKFLFALVCAAAVSCVTAYADVNQSLFSEVVSGRIAQCRALVNRGANVNARFYDGSTPLIFAASQGHIQVCAFLILQGANVNAANNKGVTALMCAAMNKKPQICELLIASGAYVNARDNSGLTAMCYAIGAHDRSAAACSVVNILNQAGGKQ